MIRLDEEALICDLAETYGIFDYKELPIPLVATLSAGLRESSRIKMKLNGTKIPMDTLLLASAVDKLAWLVWSNTEDATKGAHYPKSIVKMLTGNQEEDDAIAFETAGDFEEKRKDMLRRVRKNG